MNSMFFVVLACIFAISLCQDDTFSSKFDNIDVDAILKNDRLLMGYHKCLMTGDGCTPEGEALRKAIPKALETGCDKCTDKQKETGAKVVKFLMKEKPEIWKDLMEKYDPDMKFRTKYEEQLKTLSA